MWVRCVCVCVCVCVQTDRLRRSAAGVYKGRGGSVCLQAAITLSVRAVQTDWYLCTGDKTESSF